MGKVNRGLQDKETEHRREKWRKVMTNPCWMPNMQIISIPERKNTESNLTIFFLILFYIKIIYTS